MTRSPRYDVVSGDPFWVSDGTRKPVFAPSASCPAWDEACWDDEDWPCIGLLETYTINNNFESIVDATNIFFGYYTYSHPGDCSGAIIGGTEKKFKSAATYTASIGIGRECWWSLTLTCDERWFSGGSWGSWRDDTAGSNLSWNITTGHWKFAYDSGTYIVEGYKQACDYPMGGDYRHLQQGECEVTGVTKRRYVGVVVA